MDHKLHMAMAELGVCAWSAKAQAAGAGYHGFLEAESH